MKTYSLRFILLNLLLLPLFAACSAVSAGGETSLNDTNWKLASYQDAQGQVVSALPGKEATLKFADGQVSGTTGCNSYSAAYKVNGKNITISQAISTLMACENPQGLMDQESAFLRALGSAATFKMTGNTLEIYDANEALLLSFSAAS